MQAWAARPLDAIYAAVFIDAIVVKVRDGQVANRPVYAAIGVTWPRAQGRAGPVGGHRRGGLWDSHRFVRGDSCCWLRLCESGVARGIHGEALIFQVLP